jgi:hypothetical protein
MKLVNLPIKIKIPIFVYFFVCELNKIFRNLCIGSLCTVSVFFCVLFWGSNRRMAHGSAASSSDSVGVRKSQNVKNSWSTWFLISRSEPNKIVWQFNETCLSCYKAFPGEIQLQHQCTYDDGEYIPRNIKNMRSDTDSNLRTFPHISLATNGSGRKNG